MGYGGVRKSDKREEVAPKSRKKREGHPAAADQPPAKQERGFTGKRTYETRRKESDKPEIGD